MADPPAPKSGAAGQRDGPRAAQRPARARKQTPWDTWSDRKRTTVVAVTFFGVLVVLLGAVLLAAAVAYHPSAEQRAEDHNQAIADPQSIEGPDYGQRPQHPGDPGGWEQLALGGILTVGMAGGACLLIWSTHRKNQRRRAGDPSGAATSASAPASTSA